ncbi:MAG: carboxymuconolactone decarboxylase family protein, partial [Rhodothermales bacterium]
MAQLPYIEPEAADPITRQVYDKTVARFQMVLNIFKITGNAPEIAEKMWEIFFEILQDGQIPWATKELLILKATHMGDCLYCVTQHEAVSARLGISAEKQADIVGVEY